MVVAAATEPERLVFVDEMGTNTSLSPFMPGHLKESGRKRGCPTQLGSERHTLGEHERERDGALLLGGRRSNNQGGVRGLPGERVLAPQLRPRQIVVMDNLSSHKGSRVRELVEARGCELMYLPAYSPDLNPIEEAFSKLKALLRRAGGRTREALLEAMGRALDVVTANDARGYFEHRGYHVTAQLL